MCFQGPAEDHGTPPNCGALRQPCYQHPFSLRTVSRVKAPKTEKKTLSRTSAGIHRLFPVARALLTPHHCQYIAVVTVSISSSTIQLTTAVRIFRV